MCADECATCLFSASDEAGFLACRRHSQNLPSCKPSCCRSWPTADTGCLSTAITAILRWQAGRWARADKVFSRLHHPVTAETFWHTVQHSLLSTDGRRYETATIRQHLCLRMSPAGMPPSSHAGDHDHDADLGPEWRQ